MSVVVAHQPTDVGRLAVQEAAREADLRQTDLLVIHVAEGVDLDVIEAHQAQVSEEVARHLAEVGLGELDWALQVATGPDVAEAVLDQVAEMDASLLVIGARRRSPVGKLFLGSVSQSLILHADLPVLVVKPPLAG